MSTTELPLTDGTTIKVRTERCDESVDRHRDSTIDTLTAAIMGILLDRSATVVEHYRSDHARDTLWVRRLIVEGFEALIAGERVVWFEYAADATGTTIGTDVKIVRESRWGVNLNVTLAARDLREYNRDDRHATFEVIAVARD